MMLNPTKTTCMLITTRLRRQAPPTTELTYMCRHKTCLEYQRLMSCPGTVALVVPLKKPEYHPIRLQKKLETLFQNIQEYYFILLILISTLTII